jgi:hypothetical protein
VTDSWNAEQRPPDRPAAAGDPRQPWPPGQSWQRPPPGWPAHQQPEWAGPHAGGARRGPLLLGLGLGLILAVVIGAGLVLSRAMSFGSGNHPAAADTRAVTLPEGLGALKDIDKASDAVSTKGSQERRARNAHTYIRTQQQYTGAFGGAGVGIRTYADRGLEFLGTVVAVRAPSAGLTIGPDADPADLGLGAPQREIKHFGDLECLVVNVQTVMKGQQADPEQQTTTLCRRSNSTVTVEAFGNGRGAAQQKLIIALTEAAFAAVNGG